ncbi:MAG: hypothetical protein TREMPRED_004850 [Tremellales sp. Tagirdzhanova-0007]|nr:MAG: hypothetical protein TREMPRED_004850 [Tremellales sp. Tagirdzhanova-0007]
MPFTSPSLTTSPFDSPEHPLEHFILAEFAALDLTIPVDDVEYIARFVEEPDMDRDDKTDGIRGMLEGVVDGGILPDEGLGEALEAIVGEWERLYSLELQREPSSTSIPSPSPPKPTDVLSTLTPSELAAAQRQALLRQYGYLEGGPDEEVEDDRDRPMKEGLTGEEKKAEEERRKLVAEAIRLDGRKKKFRKKQEGVHLGLGGSSMPPKQLKESHSLRSSGHPSNILRTPLESTHDLLTMSSSTLVDLLAPNLNRDKMLYKAQAERDAQKKGANDRRERDRLALEKQRGDAAKAKVEKQKKAAKQERRG